MAKQKGIMKLEGTIGDITFFKTKDGYIAREHAPVSASRIANDPAFQRTRENMSEFSRAGKACKVLRDAIRPLLQNAKDAKVTSRLTKEMMRVIKADSTSLRGQRNVIDGEAALLEGFDFNINSKLSTTLFMAYTAAIERASGNCTVSLDAFSPAEKVVAPAGATHFNLVSMAAAIDFEKGTSVFSQAQTGALPWNNTPIDAINLATVVTGGNANPIFLLLGIQFSQEVNGQQYSLKNGSFNALTIVKVDSNIAV